MKILFLGFGSIARKHHQAWKKVAPDTEFFVLRIPRLGERSPLPDDVRECASWDQVRVIGMDSIWICTPTEIHRKSVVEAVELGLPIFLEKPIAARTDDVNEVAKRIGERNIPFTYGTVLRHHPLIARVRRFVEEGSFGRPLYYSIFCGSYLPDWRPRTDYRRSYSANRDLGGGVGIDLIHEFDYAEYFFGSIERLQGLRVRVGDLEIDSDDLTVATVVHESGVIGQVHTDYIRSVPRRDFEIGFVSGVIRGDLLTGRLKISSRDTKGTVSETEEDHGVSRETFYERQVKAFLAKDSLSDVAEAARLTNLILSLESSEIARNSK